MSMLACLLLALPAQAARPADPAPPAGVHAPRPGSEALLFARTLIVGHELSDGLGLEKELGAPGSLSDVVQAALLFTPKMPVESRVFGATNIAAPQIKAAVDAKATFVIALDYLTPYVYAAPMADEVRAQQVAAALKALEALQCPILIGDVPDLRPSLSAPKPLIAAASVPSPEALQAINASVAAWAAARKDTIVAPVAMIFASVYQNEPFVIHQNKWPQAWLPEILQTDRVHPRLHGTIAAWLSAQDALCTARKDVDPNAFDWNPHSIYRKVYESKKTQRAAAIEMEVARLRVPPSRPPPQPPPPAPPPSADDDSAKQRERKVKEAEGSEEADGGGG